MYTIGASITEFKLFVEELEHAGELLMTERLAKERMALVIVDSLADRLLYEHAHRYLEAAETMQWRRDRQYSGREQERILGDFGSKVTMALQEREFPYPDPLLDDLDAAILRVAHRYRNAGYHRGEHNDVLTGPLARLYAQAVGRALARSIPESAGTVSEEAISELDRFDWRDAEDRRGWFRRRVAAEKITGKITAPLVVEVGDLAEQLVADFEDRCAAVGESFDGLRMDGLDDEKLEALLEGAQHWAQHRGDEQLHELKEEQQKLIAAVDDVDDEVTEEQREALRKNNLAQFRRMQELKETTDLRVGVQSADGLSRQAQRLRTVSAVAPLLQRYQQLDERLELLEDAVLWTSVQWDRWVDQAIDEARGK